MHVGVSWWVDVGMLWWVDEGVLWWVDVGMLWWVDVGVSWWVDVDVIVCLLLFRFGHCPLCPGGSSVLWWVEVSGCLLLFRFGHWSVRGTASGCPALANSSSH